MMTRTKEQHAQHMREWRMSHREQHNAYMRKYYAANSEKMLAWNKASRERNKDKIVARKKAYYLLHKKELNKKKYWYDKTNCPERVKADHDKYTAKLRSDVLSAYGHRCVCCGETAWELLTVDHIDGKGHLKDTKYQRNSKYVYRDLRKRGYPKDNYRCLCMSCNWSIGLRGYCPHQKALAKLLVAAD